MMFSVHADGRMVIGRRTVRCALGRGGVFAADQKREGDGRTPAGLLPVRRVLWRPDRITAPASRLPTSPIDPADGWCDDPHDAFYNQPVRLPYAASAERMWRDDHLYDLVVVLGYNEPPVIPGAGSAIFLHVARDDYSGTEGCVALARDDLVDLVGRASPGDALHVALSDQVD